MGSVEPGWGAEEVVTRVFGVLVLVYLRMFFDRVGVCEFYDW